MAISNTVLTTALGNVYVSSGASAITSIYFCNGSGAGAVTFNLYAVPSNIDPAAVGAGQLLYQDVSVTQGDTYVIDTEKLILDSGDYLVANCSANTSVVTTISSIGI